MRLEELQQALEKVDPATVLVPPEVLEYLVQKVGKLPPVSAPAAVPATELEHLVQMVGKLPPWRATPHRQCFTVDRQMLFLYFNQEELALEPDRLLPATLILLPRPAPELLKSDSGELLMKYWRRLYHARIHLALAAESKLSSEQVQQRIEHIGVTEFAEIRQVLGEENYLLPGADERGIYIEFAAVYLEMRQFAPLLLPSFFPGIRDHGRIDRLLAEDVNGAELYEQTRPAGAADPVAMPESHSDDTHQYFRKLMAKAEQAIRAGNTVRAAILQRQAARVAPDPAATEAEAKLTLKTLIARLRSALPLAEVDLAAWHRNLSMLLDKADQGARPVEAALLFDLQKLCLEHERDIFVLDVVSWFLAAGKQPVKRSLPRQKPILIIRHLRTAIGRLPRARLSDSGRDEVAGMLRHALEQREQRLRLDFRGILTSAFQDAGLEPKNLPERAAYHKLIDEILDRITAEGFLTFGDLRDAISRNQLKLADLAEPQAFIRGDNLLRLDRRLAALLDGVYRPSEIYIRWLERLSALSFGTAAGRFFTYYVTVPLGASFLLLESANLVLGRMPWPVFLPLFLVLSGFFQALLHRSSFRRACAEVAHQGWRGVRAGLIDFPLWLIQASPLDRALRTWSFQLFYWYLLKPLLVCALVWYFRPDTMDTIFGMIIVFLAANFLLNSRPGQAAAEAVKQLLLKFVEELRGGLIPGLVRVTLSAFREVIHLMEYLLAIVDEWLLFRTGQGRAMLVARTILGVLWFPISYVGRFYMVVLVEPGINPVKLPLSSVAAKFVYPICFVPLLQPESAANQALEQINPWLRGLILATVWLLPDAVTFLFWELKENWGLFAANRSRFLQPVIVGSHGETVPRLLRPGFHSGTIPKLFARLRQAERHAQLTGNWNDVRDCRRRLGEVAEAIARFVDRDLLFYLLHVYGWDRDSLRVEPATLATNQLGLEIRHRDPALPLRLRLEDRSGRLLASIPEPGWVAELTEPQIRAFNRALAGFYEFAGVDLVEEPLRAELPSTTALGTDNVLWMDHYHGQAVHYPTWPGLEVASLLKDGAGPGSRRLIFAQAPLTWDDFVASWATAELGGKQIHLPAEKRGA